MCLITYTTCKSNLDWIKLKTSAERNDDGFGLMYHQGEQITVARSMGGLDELKGAVDLVPLGARIAIHQRLRTAGATDLARTHPFEVVAPGEGPGVYLMHNGTIGSGEGDLSDTELFVRDMARPTLLESPGLWDNMGWRRLMGKYLSNQRVLLMRDDGRVLIFGMEQGEQEGEVWYSNSYSYKAYHAPTVQPRGENGRYIYSGGEWQGGHHHFQGGYSQSTGTGHNSNSTTVAVTNHHTKNNIVRLTRKERKALRKAESGRKGARRLTLSESDLRSMNLMEIYQLVLDDPLVCASFLTRGGRPWNVAKETCENDPDTACDWLLDAAHVTRGNWGGLL